MIEESLVSVGYVGMGIRLNAFNLTEKPSVMHVLQQKSPDASKHVYRYEARTH